MDINKPRIIDSDGRELSLSKQYIEAIKENLQQLLDDYEEMVKLGRLIAHFTGSRLYELTGDKNYVFNYVRGGSHLLQDILEGKSLSDIALERKMTQKAAAKLCRDSMDTLFYRINSVQDFHQTLLYLLQRNDELGAINYTLQKQLNAIHHPTSESVEPRILPGRFIQNDTRIGWTALREEYNLYLDRAIGWYEHYIHTLLQRNIIDIGTTICTVGDCLSNTKEHIQEKYSLSAGQINNMERLLNEHALTFDIPTENVLLHFYYPYFTGLKFQQFKFSETIRNCLYRIHIHTIGETMLTEEASLKEIDGMGPANLKKLKNLLATLGLSLGFTPEKVRELYYRPSAI